MCALNFTKFPLPLAVKDSFRPIYLELPLESPMSKNRNTNIFSSKLACPTPNCYLDNVIKLPIQSETPRFIPLVAMFTKITISILTTDDHP